FPLIVQIAVTGVGVARDAIHPSRPEYQTAALGLRELGLQDGDRLAVVGYAYNCYYARCARLRIVAQISDPNELSSLSAAELRAVGERLASIRVKALVAWNRPEAFLVGN